MKPTGSGVQSVRRAITLMKLLALSDEGHRVSDLARDAGLAVSTTHRLLTTLEVEGFVQFEPERTLWHIGRDAYSVGSAYIQKYNFIAPALPFLRKLRDETRETVNLGVLDKGEIITISQVESREIVRAISPAGGRVPASCSGMGKAILATWSDPDIAAFTARTGFHPMTPRSHRHIGSLMEDIVKIRAQGYSVDNEEHAAGLRCVASAVWSRTGDAICAISVSAISARMPQERVSLVGNKLRSMANALTTSLAGDQ
ncbi:IclR family transcriptional regulator [Roseovarius sp. S4756]|uniref:IclR family transcriptional regulator n=1 Tax=Roseovarius maritimus TaxID=3342637 RepID=UPI00372B9D8C